MWGLGGQSLRPTTHIQTYYWKITETCNYNLKIFLLSLVILHREITAKYVIADWALREFPRITLLCFQINENMPLLSPLWNILKITMLFACLDNEVLNKYFLQLLVSWGREPMTGVMGSCQCVQRWYRVATKNHLLFFLIPPERQSCKPLKGLTSNESSLLKDLGTFPALTAFIIWARTQH